MFDSTQFNGFMRNELDDLLFHDLWSLYVFNESDLHSAAYYYIRKYFEKRRSDNIFVRCEPKLCGKKPDLVIYDRGRPTHLIELKMFPGVERVDEVRIDADLQKVADIMEAIPTIKWGFFLFVYDSDDDFGISDPKLRRRGFPKISVSPINLRRTEGTKRRRTDYDGWRKDFDRLCTQHSKW